MAKTSPHLEWCIVRLGEDLNWWVDEISDEIHWDADGLSIIDPRQMAHIIDLIEPLQDYGFEPDILESAFFGFQIESDLGEGRVRVTRSSDNILEGEDPLFALPNILDEETGPYADFIDTITRLRVLMLNDSIGFEKKLTVDELEEYVRDEENNSFLEGRSIHSFQEICSILEYTPAGFEPDGEDDDDASDGDDVDVEAEFPDLDEAEDTDTLKEDETMRWEDDDEKEENYDDEEEEERPSKDDEDDDDESPSKDDEEDDDEDEEEDEDEDEEEERPRRGSRK